MISQESFCWLYAQFMNTRLVMMSVSLHTQTVLHWLASQTCCSFVCPSSTESGAKFWREFAVVEFLQLFWEAYARCSSQLELPVDLTKVPCYITFIQTNPHSSHDHAHLWVSPSPTLWLTLKTPALTLILRYTHHSPNRPPSCASPCRLCRRTYWCLSGPLPRLVRSQTRTWKFI